MLTRSKRLRSVEVQPTSTPIDESVPTVATADPVNAESDNTDSLDRHGQRTQEDEVQSRRKRTRQTTSRRSQSEPATQQVNEQSTTQTDVPSTTNDNDMPSTINDSNSIPSLDDNTRPIVNNDNGQMVIDTNTTTPATTTTTTTTQATSSDRVIDLTTLDDDADDTAITTRNQASVVVIHSSDEEGEDYNNEEEEDADDDDDDYGDIFLDEIDELDALEGLEGPTIPQIVGLRAGLRSRIRAVNRQRNANTWIFDPDDDEFNTREIEAVNALLEAQRRTRQTRALDATSVPGETRYQSELRSTTFGQSGRRSILSPSSLVRQQQRSSLFSMPMSVYSNNDLTNLRQWQALMQPVILHELDMAWSAASFRYMDPFFSEYEDRSTESSGSPTRARTPLPSARDGYSRDILPENANLVETSTETATTNVPSTDAATGMINEKGKQPINTTIEGDGDDNDNDNDNDKTTMTSQDIVEEIEEVAILESDYVCARCANDLAIYAPDTPNLERIGTTNIHAAKCGHVFCHDCLKPLRSRKKCPVCDVSLNARSFRRLFLA